MVRIGKEYRTPPPVLVRARSEATGLSVFLRIALKCDSLSAL
jgi:hypothetical protein